MRWSTVRNAGLLFVLGLAATRSTTGCSNVPYDSSSSASTSGPSAVGPTAGGNSSGGIPVGVGTAIPPIPEEFEGGSPACVGSSLAPPQFGPMCSSGTPPPPITGGTLLVTKGGIIVIISDPDRDAIYVVDISTGRVTFTIALQPGDEPGRLAEDAEGLIHVALRSGGALVTLNPATGTITARRQVCPAPRGVAYDSTRDLVWVACATGEVVGLPPGGGPATTSWVVERDLRDVIVNNGALTVSSFRAAQLLALDGDGTVGNRTQLPAPDSQFTPHVVWRTVPGPGGTTVCVHQEHSQQSINTTMTGGYGGGCGGEGGPVSPPPLLPLLLEDGGFATGDSGVVLLPTPLPSLLEGSSVGPMGSVLTVYGADGAIQVNQTFSGVLPVDVAVSADGSTFLVATPGSAFTQSAAGLISQFGTGPLVPLPFTDFTQVPIAVGFDISGDALVQTRDPANLWVFPSSDAGNTTPWSIPLSSVSRCDSGHDIFHTHAGVAIACASCHPEGGDDGHVWILNGDQRRTPSLRGTIAGTAPYHWPGDEPDLPTLVNDVYTVRMAGQLLEPDQMSALTGWVQTIAPPPAPSWIDAAAAAAGEAIFKSAATACSTCHSGAKFTDNQTVDVGTGGPFQVPPLVGVGWRTPLLHNGCAATIADRFGMCSTPQHGSISTLSATDLQNLEAYLETL